MGMFKKDTEKNSQVETRVILTLEQENGILKSELQEKEQTIKFLREDLKLKDKMSDKIKRRVTDKSEQFIREKEIEITRLEKDNVLLEEKLRNHVRNVEQQIKIKSNTLNLQIEGLKAELDSSESVSKRKYEMEIEKLKNTIEILNERVILHKEIAQDKKENFATVLKTIEIMGVGKAAPIKKLK